MDNKENKEEYKFYRLHAPNLFSIKFPHSESTTLVKVIGIDLKSNRNYISLELMLPNKYFTLTEPLYKWIKLIKENYESINAEYQALSNSMSILWNNSKDSRTKFLEMIYNEIGGALKSSIRSSNINFFTDEDSIHKTMVTWRIKLENMPKGWILDNYGYGTGTPSITLSYFFEEERNK